LKQFIRKEIRDTQKRKRTLKLIFKNFQAKTTDNMTDMTDKQLKQLDKELEKFEPQFNRVRSYIEHLDKFSDEDIEKIIDSSFPEEEREEAKKYLTKSNIPFALFYLTEKDKYDEIMKAGDAVYKKDKKKKNNKKNKKKKKKTK